MASSYLTYRLTGAYVLDHHSASQSGPLYDRHEHAWIEEWAKQTAPGLALPRLLVGGQACTDSTFAGRYGKLGNGSSRSSRGRRQD